jgi:hypothetical protein
MVFRTVGRRERGVREGFSKGEEKRVGTGEK